MVKKIIAIGLIFLATSVAWAILGGTTVGRTYIQNLKLYGKVDSLWGDIHTQHAPKVYYEKNNLINLEASNINVALDLTHRKKGLLWYDTYKVDFQGSYKIINPLNRIETFKINFILPSHSAIYDNFHFTVNGKPIEANNFIQKTLTIPVVLKQGEECVFGIGYTSQGLDKWFYRFGENANKVKNFTLTMATNFKNIDFPENSISPSLKEQTSSGWKLTWQFKSLVSGFQIGMDMPSKLNPGPLASRISFFAPVSLLFFFFVIFMISTIKDIKIHPMNYLFLATAFFAFHLLFSYTVDHLDIYLSFLISSLVSMFLVISYMRIVVGARFAAIEIGISQFMFLILFSLAHFFEGYTGLTVTIGAIITLGIMMRLTAKINWEAKFK